MKYLHPLKKFCLGLSLLCLNVQANASSIFDDNAINIWLINPNTQAVTTYSLGNWVDNHADLQNFTVSVPYQALVNGLPRSSQAMSPFQAGISIIGLGQADISSNKNMGPQLLAVSPDSGSLSQTIEVLMRIDGSAVEGGEVDLKWQINGSGLQAIRLSGINFVDADGYITRRLFFVKDGTYNIIVQLYRNNQLISEQNKTYTLTNDDPLGEQRDSDGDGIPDLIEAAIGLDPLNGDFTTDTDNNGWSDFDEWLRCDSIDPTKCGIPTDTDGDGWSDFDEALRGTQKNDYILQAIVGQENDESYIKSKLSLQEKPAARRLYEVEYLLNGNIGINANLHEITLLQASEFDGTGLYDLNSLVSAQTLKTLGVNEDRIEKSVLLSHAADRINSGEWPMVRLAAAHSLAIRASTKAANSEVIDPSKIISLLVLEAAGDLDLSDYPANKTGDWSTVLQWRDGLIIWLKQELVKKMEVTFSENSTLASLLFEASLAQEASLRGEDASTRLGYSVLPQTWINHLYAEMTTREASDLYAWFTRIALSNANILNFTKLAATTSEFLKQMPATGTNSSEWLSQRLKMPVVLAEQGCFITSTDLAGVKEDPEFYRQYLTRCPLYYTELELADWQTQASQTRYLLRMTMFNSGPDNISNSPSLASYLDDTDRDNRSNMNEVLFRQYATATYPWLADSDGDAINDDVDECSTDPLNLCAGNPNDPVLKSAQDIVASVGVQGGVTLLELTLSNPAVNAVSFTYIIEALVNDGDTAIAGVDFVAASQTVNVKPGQQSIIIPVSLLANELAGQRRFRIRFEDVIGAIVDEANAIQFVSVISPGVNAPLIQLAKQTFNVAERSTVYFDASASVSGISDPILVFMWQQTSGPAVTLLNDSSSAPSFVAPQAINLIDLAFSVSVQNSAGAEAVSSLLVSVNPVDDPPRVISNPSYTVQRNATLLINKADLLAFVQEPDGEILTVTGPTQQIQGGSLIETSTHFEFIPDANSAPVTITLDNNPIETVSWKTNGVAYRTAKQLDEGYEHKIHTWTPQDGKAVIDVSTQSYSDILTSPLLDIIYYARYNADTNTTWIKWMNADNTFGEIDSDEYSSLFGARIDPASGILYQCSNNGWRRIDPANNSITNISLSCERFRSGQAVIDNKFCLTSSTGLACSEDGISFEPVFTLPNSSSQINGVFSNEAGTLILYNDSISKFIALVNGENSGRLLHTIADYNTFIRGFWIDNVFYTLLPVNNAESQQGAQLFKWQAGDDRLIGRGDPDLFSSEHGRASYSGLIEFGDDFLWVTKTSSQIYRKFSIDRDSGIFTQIDDDLLHERAIAKWLTVAIQSTEVNEGGCDWFALDPSGSLSSTEQALLQNITCYGRIVYGSSLVYTRYDNELGFNEHFVTYGGGGLAQTQFSVDIADENGNNVQLLITIAIEQGDE